MGSDQGQHISFRGNMRDQDRKTGGNICKTDKFPERMRFICDLTGNFKSVEYRRFLQHMQSILSIGKAVEQKTINDVGSVASLGHCTEIDEPPGCCADLLLNGSRDWRLFLCPAQHGSNRRTAPDCRLVPSSAVHCGSRHGNSRLHRCRSGSTQDPGCRCKQS